MEEKKDFIAKPIEDAHENLVNTIATCLIREPSFYQTAEERVVKLINACNAVAGKDPEFIFLLAYYARNELYLRSSTNFLLAYGATKIPECSKLLTKYMPHCIKLPSDLLEVIEISQALQENEDKKIKIPSCLKKVCKKIFAGFSEYHLGKYCSENSRKREMIKAKKRGKPEEEKKEVVDSTEEAPIKVVNKKRLKVPMKKLIRICHINEPKYEVLSILGKKYPGKEEFEKQFPGKTYEEMKTGTRMRLPVPITWETELSAKGNRPEVWKSLIMSNKLPYMAMLRNIRNLLITGVEPEVHKKVCEKIQNYDSVISSKLFPFRFLSAYEAIKIDLDTLKKRVEDPENAKKEEEKKSSPVRGRFRRIIIRRGGKAASPDRKASKKPKKFIIPKDLPTEEIIRDYKKALDNAVKMAIAQNIKPIKGKSVVFSDTSGSMSTPISGGNGMGSARNCMDVGILMSIMMKYACEECEFYIFSSPGSENLTCYKPIMEFDKENLLSNVEMIKKEAEELGGGTDFPFEFWLNAIETKKHIDLFVIFSDMMITEGHNDISGGDNLTASGIVNEYRMKVNPKLIFVAVDLRGYSIQLPIAEDKKDPLNIMICGYSDSILRFISERQVSQIEYIRSLKSKIP